MESKLRFEVVQAQNGEWFPRVRARNNEPWFSSETHPTKAGAQRSLRRLIEVFAGSPDIGAIVTVPRHENGAAKRAAKRKRRTRKARKAAP